MNVLLQKSYGTLSTAYSSPQLKIFQGATQGNGTAPVLWMIVSIILVRYIYLKGLATTQYSHMSHMVFTLIALINVDDTDLNVLRIEEK